MPTTQDQARPKPESYDTHVAIVGAGPIGLTLDCASTLLTLDGGRASTHDQLLAAVRSAAAPDWIHPRLVGGDPAAAADSPSAVARLFDLDRHAHTAYGLQVTPALVLIRPDGHIAFRGTAEDADDLQRHLRHIAGSDARRA